MRDLGLISLYLSCAAALWAVYAGARGEAKARRVNLVSILTAGLSTLTLVFCFLTDDFRLAYVARNSARSLPVLYKISALWAGQSGSLLLWLLILSFYSFAVQRSRPLREGGLDLRVNAILGAVRAVFALLLLFVSSPFELLADPPYSGAGLNPMLQSLGMVVHPPLLFAGFSGFAVPFALAAAQLWPGDSSGRWLELARPWALTAWLFLTAGIVTGGQWAYSELGWGATGPGTRWKTPPFCLGSPAQPWCTPCFWVGDSPAVSGGVICSARSPLCSPSSAPSSPEAVFWIRCTPFPEGFWDPSS